MKAHKVFRENGVARQDLVDYGEAVPFKTASRKLIPTEQVLPMGCGREGGAGDRRQRQVWRRRGLKGNDFDVIMAFTGKAKARRGLAGRVRLHTPARAA